VSGFNPAYLRAKEAVDSRSRNQRVWNRFLRELSAGRGGSLAPETKLTEPVIQDWLQKRRIQFDEGRLALLTHQWDVLAKK